jgi:DNA-3-methyladenine glycosylase II
MTLANLQEGLTFLAKADPDFARALTLIKPLPDRTQPTGFRQLTKIIVEQQVSLASAAAIWGRLDAAIKPFTPDAILSRSEDELRAFGLSRQKARYSQALATEISSGRLNLDELHQLDDEQAQAALVQVKGIGRWTAEIYLFSCLGRPNIWPAGDVALQIALHHLKDLSARPTPKEMDELAAHLQPYRTLAAQILWRYYADVVKAPKT